MEDDPNPILPEKNEETDEEDMETAGVKMMYNMPGKPSSMVDGVHASDMKNFLDFESAKIISSAERTLVSARVSAEYCE